MSELVRLLQYVKPYRLRFFGAVVLMVGVGFFEAVAAFLIGPISTGSSTRRLRVPP